MIIDLASLSDRELTRLLWLIEEVAKLNAEIAKQNDEVQKLNAELRASLALISDPISDDIGELLRAELTRRTEEKGAP